MRHIDILPAWGRILRGYRPLLSIEITKECPLRCPGCYACEPEHLGGGTQLRQLSYHKGERLVDAVLGLVRRHARFIFRSWVANRWSAIASWTSFFRSSTA